MYKKFHRLPGSITNGHVTSTSIDIPHVYHAGNDVNAICEVIFYPSKHADFRVSFHVSYIFKNSRNFDVL